MKPNLIIIAAISKNNIIGRGDKIPWDIPEDLKRFKTLTLHHPVIMGRRTYESVLERLGKPLSERKNIVLTRRNLSYEGIYVVHSVGETLKMCEGENSYVAGGGEIYKLFLPLANKMEITRIHKQVFGDVFFPEVNWGEWEEVFRDFRGEYSFLTYIRRGYT